MATAAEADVAAFLHVSRLPESFLAFLGPAFLRRLYRRIATTPGAFLLMAHADGSPVGFVAGSTDLSGLYRSFVLRDGLPAALHSLGPLVRGWRRGLETLRHGSSGQSGVGQGAELLAIALDPSWQGRGVGTTLVTAFLDELGDRAVEDAYVVVAADNAAAIRLYRNAGFAEADRFELHPGTTSLLLQWHRHAPCTRGAVDPA